MGKSMYELREKLCDELEEVARKPEMGAGDLELAHKLTDTIKNIDKICIMEEDGSYSQAGDWEARGRFDNRYSENGNSYRGRNRDSMGRYSRRRGGYSRDSGKESLMEHVEAMMDEASTERERDIIRRFKEQLSSM